MAGQVWAVNTLGGYFFSLNLSDELREALQPLTKFRQFADVKDGTMQGKKKGDIFTWDVVGNITRGNRALIETNTMGEGNFTIYQATMTISERGFSVPYSGKLEALSKFEVRQPIMRALKNDASKDLDALAYTQFKRARIRAVLQTSTTIFTTNGTATATASIAMNTGHVKDIRDYMAEANIPAYVNDDYYAIARPNALRTLKNNLESLHQYTETGFKMIMNGEIGRYEMCRFVEQTNVPRGGAADSGTFSEYTGTADAWNNSSTGAMDWAFFFGEDTAAEGVCVPEEMRAKIPSDYGRSKGVAWYYLGNFALVHEQASEARIVMVDSAV
jgi:N4-gp56 family major capsid protein